MVTINSIKDERISLARELGSRSGRERHQKILLEGTQAVNWALEHRLKVLFILNAQSNEQIDIDKYQQRGIEVYVISAGINKKVTGRSYVVPVIGVATLPVDSPDTYDDLVVVLDDVKDFGNIGTIIRTCSAFGIKKVISSTCNFDLYQRKTIDASRGTVFGITVDKYNGSSETIACLRKQGYQLVVTSPRGNHLQSLVDLKPGPIALIIGNETRGVNQDFEEQADHVIQIPMADSVESLNVGVAAGISVYELQIKQVISMLEQRIKSTLGREMNVTGSLIQQAVDSELKKVSDFSSQQVIFLMVLKCDQEMTVENMCRQFGILSSEAEKFLSNLVEKNLIIQDNTLEITPKGEELLAKLWAILENTEKKILESFSDNESKEFKKQLNRIQNNCLNIISSE